MATSSADRFLFNSGVTSDPQPDDTARKGLRRLASTAPAHRACQRGWVTSFNPAFTRQAVEHTRHHARVDGKHGFQLNGVIHTSQRMEQSTRNWVAVISMGER